MSTNRLEELLSAPTAPPVDRRKPEAEFTRQISIASDTVSGEFRVTPELANEGTAAAEAIAQLPPDSRRAVSAAHGLFAELSRRLRRTPAAQIRRTRIRVPDARKAVIIVRALGGRP